MVLSSASNSLILQHESRGGGVVSGWKGGEEWEGITEMQWGRV